MAFKDKRETNGMKDIMNDKKKQQISSDGPWKIIISRIDVMFPILFL
jgi:hypothetical protein